ncbi:small hydrophobic protein [Streptomyces sp. SID11385]|nr:small hydrophobic protein [Streptomyces sp. SID11385]
MRRFVEDKIPTGLWVRVFVYVVAAHGVAAFLYLLFTLGAKNQ